MIVNILIAFIVSIQSLTTGFPLNVSDAISTDKYVVLPKRNYSRQSLGVKTTAKSAIVIDFKTNKILYEKNINQKLSIASLSKLMTALVFLKHNPGWNKVITMSSRDEVYYPKYIYRGEQVTVRDLFNVSLIGSDNNATRALVRATGLSQKKFVALMNDEANKLKMKNTFFADVTGLNPKNVSSVFDLTVLAKEIWQNQDILSVTAKKKYELQLKNSQKKRLVHSTNKLLDSYLHIKAGKTGFIDEAGYCLMTLVENDKKNKIVVAVLGSKMEEDRFQDVKTLSWWAFKNYLW